MPAAAAKGSTKVSTPRQPLPLLQDFYRHFAISRGIQHDKQRISQQQQQQQQQIGYTRAAHRMMKSQLMLKRKMGLPPIAEGLGTENKQASLNLSPNPELTRRYYKPKPSHSNKYDYTQMAMDLSNLYSGKPQADQQQQQQQQHCKRYPMSHVIYPNLVKEPQSSTGFPAASNGSNQWQLEVRYLPKPGALAQPTRSPTFVNRERFRRSRSNLEHALASQNSQDVVVQKAITQLRDALVLPIATGRQQPT